MIRLVNALIEQAARFSWLHCLGRRRSSREIERAVRDSRRRMATLTQAERKQLWNNAMDIVHPDGWWVCACGDVVGYPAAKGEPCPMCKRSETPTTEVSRGTDKTQTL